MSKEKITNSDACKTPAVPSVRNSGNVENPKSPEPEIVALEIEDNDFGSDPYNRTGSFCVLKFDKDH